jgi:hypothetical protein
MAEVPRDPPPVARSDAVGVRRVDPTLPGIRRFAPLGPPREVPAKARGPGQRNNLNTGRNLTKKPDNG